MHVSLCTEASRDEQTFANGPNVLFSDRFNAVKLSEAVQACKNQQAEKSDGDAPVLLAQLLDHPHQPEPQTGGDGKAEKEKPEKLDEGKVEHQSQLSHLWSDYASLLKEAFEIDNLTNCHRENNNTFKDRPIENPGVSVLVDFTVSLLSHREVRIFLYDSQHSIVEIEQQRGELVRHTTLGKRRGGAAMDGKENGLRSQR